MAAIDFEFLLLETAPAIYKVTAGRGLGRRFRSAGELGREDSLRSGDDRFDQGWVESRVSGNLWIGDRFLLSIYMF